MDDAVAARVRGLALAVEDLFERGRPSFRQRAELTEAIAEITSPPGVDGVGWPSELWAGMGPVGRPWLSTWMQRLTQGGPPLNIPFAQLTHELQERCRIDAVLTFATAKTRAAGSSWFRLDDLLAYALLSTDAKGIRPDDVRMPLPAFCLEFPPKLIELHHRLTGWHEVRSIWVIEGRYDAAAIAGVPEPFATAATLRFGRRIMLICDCEPNAASSSAIDNNYAYIAVPLYDNSRSVEDLSSAIDFSDIIFDTSIADRHLQFLEERSARLNGVDVSRGAALRLVQRFVLNFLLFLTSEQAEIKKTAPKTKKHKGRRADRHVEKTCSPTILVNSRIKIAREVRDEFRSGQHTGRQLTVRSIVRGHYRQQACGPQWRDRKPVWIAPHVRGKDVIGPVRGHDYDVER